MEKLTTDSQFHEAIVREGVTVVVFKTTWCPDCHYIEPFMPEVESKYAGKFTFYTVDRDEMASLCEQYAILGIPSFIVFRGGREIVRFVSKLRKTRQEIEQFLDRALEVSNALK